LPLRDEITCADGTEKPFELEMGKTQRQRRRDDSDSYSATLSGLQQQLERRRRKDEVCQIKCCNEMDGLLFSVETKEKMKREGGHVAMATGEEIYRSTR
jgi:hypothetical protein